jgi:hypothetical protein
MRDSQLAGPQRPLEPASIYSHSRTRTTSSNIFPIQTSQLQPPMQLTQPAVGQNSRRSPSVGTFSTVSSSGMVPPAAYRTSPTTDLRRSTSGRSATGSMMQPSSYVALLRRQKATVWCDRAQYEDPRILAQQRAAKMRAAMEVTGPTYSPAANSARTGTGLSARGGRVAAKIKHHGKPSIVGYAPGDHYVGVGGVPLRLSATEVEAEDSDEDDPSMQKLHHRRTGSSGRSSTASGRRGIGYRSSGGLAPSGSLVGGRRWSPGDTPERTGSMVEEQVEYDGQLRDDAASGKAQSMASGSSGERADNVPDLGGSSRLQMNSATHAAVTREKSVKSVDDLRRRGSVDERSMTLTTGRLFIANPD